MVWPIYVDGIINKLCGDINKYGCMNWFDMMRREGFIYSETPFDEKVYSYQGKCWWRWGN